MKPTEPRQKLWTPATEFYKDIKDKKEWQKAKNLLLQNLMKTNLQLLKNLDLSNTVLF